MGADLTAEFEQFVDAISIGEPQTSRMESAASTIIGFLAEKYEIPESKFFLQGSYPNQTAVEPVGDGEYDIDLVAVCARSDQSANDALNELAKFFEGDGRYKDRLIRKKPCIRLEYAPDDVGKFHVDVVPTRVTGKPTPPLDAPRRDEGWHGTAPAEYTQWCLAQGERYARTVKILKRWRDEQQTVRNAIKSIVLQVLVAQHMPTDSWADSTRTAQTLRSLYDAVKDLPSAPNVWNPVLPSEDLGARWTDASFKSFVEELEEAVEWAEKAEAADDKVEAAEAWREILGDEFPAPTANALGLTIDDTSHQKAFGAKGWRLALNERYRVTVTAQQQRGKKGQKRKQLVSGRSVVFAGYNLRFKATVFAPGHCQVWWQVTNTGRHASNKSALRGEFLTAKTMARNESRDSTEHWESTAYTGVHRVRAILVRDDVVVAYSPYFEVPIYSTNWRTAFGLQ